MRRQEEALRGAQKELLTLLGDADLYERRMAEANAQIAELGQRREREMQTAERTKEQLASSEVAIATAEADLESSRSELRRTQGVVETERTRLRLLEEKKGQAGLVEVRLRERGRAYELDRERATAQLRAATAEVGRCDRRVEVLARYLPELGRLVSTLDSLGAWLQSELERLAGGLERARASSETATRTMTEWGGSEAELQQERDDVNRRLTELQVAAAHVEDRRQLLREDVAELRRRHLSPRSVSREEVAGVDEEYLRQAVERAEKRRERIGPVNPLAEQECREAEERVTLLAEQRHDLESSVEQLQAVIGELDIHIEKSFSEVFEATQRHFASVIATVFPGAKGVLRLVTETGTRGNGDSNGAGRTADGDGMGRTADGNGAQRAAEGGGGNDEWVSDERAEDDSRGIALAIKFPNKAPRSLSLLSGGEKAMAAISFLFALFLAKPCPFYILDEIEASLDDVNIRRFLSLLREYRDRDPILDHHPSAPDDGGCRHSVWGSPGRRRSLARTLPALRAEGGMRI